LSLILDVPDPKELIASPKTSRECITLYMALGWPTHSLLGCTSFSAGAHLLRENSAKLLKYYSALQQMQRRGLALLGRGSTRWMTTAAACSFGGVGNVFYAFYDFADEFVVADIMDEAGITLFIDAYDYELHSPLAEQIAMDYTLFIQPSIYDLVARRGDLAHPRTYWLWAEWECKWPGRQA